VRAARENATASGVAHAVEVREGTLDGDGVFDLIVANISGLTLERLAPTLARSLRPGGALISSGFLEDAVAGLSSAYEAVGLTVDRVIEDGVWRAIIAKRGM
jgi:ribosomal protein L11 methyltransferase